MIEGVDIKVEWEELIDSFSEDASTLQILSACIDKFGDGGCGLSFSDWGKIVRDQLEQREIESESFWDNFDYADTSNDYDSDEDDEFEEDLPIDVVLPQETELNQDIDDVQSEVLRTYLSEALKYRQLTNEESVRLLKRYRSGDSKAYDILVKSNIRFVIYIVRWYKCANIIYEDLIQEGILGLLRAIQRADLLYDNFTDYIKTYVFQSISTAGITLPYLIKIPANQVRTHRKVSKFIEKYELQFGDEPSLSDIEDYFYSEDIDVATAYKLPRDLTDFTYSFDDWENIESNLPYIEDYTNQEYNKRCIKALLNSLSHREALILRKYYGIDEPMELSLENIGNALSLTRERVRQILVKSIRKLREILNLKRGTEEVFKEPVEQKVRKSTREVFKKPIRKTTEQPIEEKAISVISPIKNNKKTDGPINIELQLSLMDSIKVNGYKIPHKAIYVLTLIKGICEGFINPYEIYLNDKLIITFNLLWNKYVPVHTPFAAGIANPYIQLSLDNFYHLYPSKQVHVKGKNWTIDSVRKVCEFAYVSQEFCDYIMVEENRKRVFELLISQYGLKRISNDSVEDNSKVNEVSPIQEFKEEIIHKTKVPSLPQIIKKGRQIIIIRLTYPNGVLKESDDYLTTYLDFIKYAGPKRVEGLNIHSLGVNLVVRKEGILPKYKAGFKEVGKGYFLNTVSTTHRKYEVMSFISEQLNLGVKVELVAKELTTKTKVKEVVSLITEKELKSIQKPQPKLDDGKDLQSSIIDYIARFPNSKAYDIADYLRVTRKEVNSILYRLQKEGRCEVNSWFQWSLAVLSPPTIVKEPTEVYQGKITFTEDIEGASYNRIFSMKFSSRDGYKAPHKAIYLLSIFDCIEQGEITSGRFQVTPLLLQRFEDNWKQYVHLKCFSPTIWNPIFYMEDNIIHREWNADFAGTKPNSLNHCELVFEYLEIASDLWEALQDKKTIEKIKSTLIDIYITHGKIIK